MFCNYLVDGKDNIFHLFSHGFSKDDFFSFPGCVPEDGALLNLHAKHLFKADSLCAELEIIILKLLMSSRFVLDGIWYFTVKFNQIGFSDEAKQRRLEAICARPANTNVENLPISDVLAGTAVATFPQDVTLIPAFLNTSPRCLK